MRAKEGFHCTQRGKMRGRGEGCEEQLLLCAVGKAGSAPFLCPKSFLLSFSTKHLTIFFLRCFTLFQFLISLFTSHRRWASVSLSSFTSISSSHSFSSYLSCYLYPRSATLTVKHLSLFLPSFSASRSGPIAVWSESSRRLDRALLL